MKYRDPDDSSVENIRANALAAAVVLRECSLRFEISRETRRACRALMRAQAIAWRLPFGGGGAHAGR